LKHHGQTGLHWAALGGHAEIVRLLLARGASVEVRDERYQGTPLDWALYGWRERRADARFYDVVAQLVGAGARLDASWFSGGREREEAWAAMRADARMMAALGPAAPGAA
ncbi:MAG TPA: ankyrin repeat domain-containing protein, partial [Candidatus Thermoplasmatota archaeon]|nr:ankyrin repeat domain-containing protein [Candidatus Thermoplasmatota archaeon]